MCHIGFMLPLSRASLLFVFRAHFWADSFATLQHLAFAFLWQHFRARNYFPISVPANRKFYCSCIRIPHICVCLSLCVLGGERTFYLCVFCPGLGWWRKRRKQRHQPSFGKYIAVTTSHITHQYPAGGTPHPPTCYSQRFTHKQKDMDGEGRKQIENDKAKQEYENTNLPEFVENKMVTGAAFDRRV